MDSLSNLWRQDKIETAAKDSFKRISTLLSEVQAGVHDQCTEFSSRNHETARR
jgi:hypothetical protein